MVARSGIVQAFGAGRDKPWDKPVPYIGPRQAGASMLRPVTPAESGPMSQR